MRCLQTESGHEILAHPLGLFNFFLKGTESSIVSLVLNNFYEVSGIIYFLLYPLAFIVIF